MDQTIRICDVEGMTCLPNILFRLLVSAALTVPVLSPVAARTPSQVYVAGEFAQSQGDFAAAARYFGAALQSDPADVLLKRRVFDLSLQSGDTDRAVLLARDLVKDAPNDSQLLLTLAVESIRLGNWNQANTYLGSLSNAGLDGILGPVLKSWVAVGRGKQSEADEILAILDKTPSYRPFAAEQRAWIALATGKWADASAAFSSLLGESGTSGSVRARIAGACAAQRAGNLALATKILNGDADDQAHPWLIQARQTVASGQQLVVPVTTAQAGIAEMLRRVSLDLSREENAGSAPGYAWLSSRLAPGTPETLLTLVDVLSATKQGETALNLIKAMPTDDVSNQVRTYALARTLTALNRDKEVVTLLEGATAKWPDRVDLWTSLGDARRNMESYEAASVAYTKAIDLVGKPKEANWGLFFVRGISFERMKQWQKAEADMQQALALKPNQPSVLNYLGYSWLEQKRNLPEATKMIEQALEQRPSDGAIIDSLGWAYFLNGNVPKAVERLEEALAAVPNDPTVNEHLGDAYWAVGRMIEARHRWQAALDAEPSEAIQRQRLNNKIESGTPEGVSVSRESRQG